MDTIERAFAVDTRLSAVRWSLCHKGELDAHRAAESFSTRRREGFPHVTIRLKYTAGVGFPCFPQ